jgi:lipopolysaccharide/colanic/teichoic acid biosynthesis glycosyltransferase
MLAVKRAIDIGVSATALLLLLPVLALIAALVVVDSPGPVFYRAARAGHRGRPLWMLKFRKMHVGATGPGLTASGDQRLTRVGRVLASTHLDELPQLWHVLWGDMSLIGPRPEDPRFAGRFRSEYEDILRVRPGITGWTQLAFADEGQLLQVDDPEGRYVSEILPRKVALDRMYAARPTLARDVRIAAATAARAVLRRPVIVDPATGRLGIGSGCLLATAAGDARVEDPQVPSPIHAAGEIEIPLPVVIRDT